MAINEKVSITLADDKKFGIGVINGIVTSESFSEGIRSISVTPISPIKTPYTDQQEKHNLEFTRYKQDCRKRALDLAHSEVSTLEKAAAYLKQKGEEYQYVTTNVEEAANKYYNWLISIPND